MIASGTAADLDSVEDALRSGHQVAPKWVWVDGQSGPVQAVTVARRNSAAARSKGVTLDPGEETWVCLPGRSFLRLSKKGGFLERGDVSVDLTNGSGLLVEAQVWLEERRGILLVDPDDSLPTLARIRRPRSFQRPIQIDLATSRLDSPPDLAAYRNLVPMGRDVVMVREQGEATSQLYWRLEGGGEREVTLKGRDRFALDARLLYPRSESELNQTFRIRLLEEGGKEEVCSLEFATSAETRDVVTVAGDESVVSRRERGYFSLSEERSYRLRVESSAPVLIRLLGRGREYLFERSARLNQSAAGIEAELPAPAGSGNLWTTDPDRWLEGSQLLEERWRLCNRLGRDNTRSGGGVLAAGLFQQVAANRSDYPALQRAATELASQYTLYRDLPPRDGSGGGRRWRYFNGRRLDEVRDERNLVALGAQHTDAALKRLGSAVFHRLDESLTYDLPRRPASTQLRLAVDQAAISEPQSFEVHFDDGETRRVTILPRKTVTPLLTRPRQGEGGLALLAQQHPDAQRGTLDYPFSHRREPAPLIEAGYIELKIPPTVDRVSLIGTQSGEETWVALQVRASKEYQLSERSYRTQAEWLGGRAEVSRLFRSYLRNGEQVSESLPEVELINHWTSLRRFLSSRHRLLADSVARQEECSVASVDRALELLGEGNVVLGERMLRYLFFRSGDNEERARAFAELDRFAIEAEDLSRRLNLYAAAAVEEPDNTRLARLGRLLLQEGDVDLALMVAMTLEDAELRSWTTLANGWWASFEEVPPDPWFQGLAASLQGRSSEARQFWQEAGERGAAWLHHLEKSEEIRRSGDLWAWSRWERDYPGPWMWATASENLVRSESGAATIFAPERDLHFQVYLARPGEPVSLRVPSPRHLRLEFRPLHQAGSMEPVEGWIEVSTRAERRRVPVVTNQRSVALEVVGRPELGLGAALRSQLPVRGWNESVRIEPHGVSVAVRVTEKRPLVPVGVLPKLSEETAAVVAGSREGEDSDGGEEGWLVRADTGERYALRSLRTMPPSEPFPFLKTVSMGTSPLSVERKKMDALLWAYEVSPERRSELLAKGAHLAAQLPRDPEMDRLQGFLTRYASWRPLSNFERSAGVRKIESEGWRPESPEFSARLELLSPLGENEQILSGKDGMVSNFQFQTEREIRVVLSQERVPFLPQQGEIVANVSWDDDTPLPVRLGLNGQRQEFFFAADPGPHSLAVSVAEPIPNHFLRVKVDSVSGEDLFRRSSSRNYVVATQETPARTRLAGPTWIRVDELKEGSTQRRYQFVNGVEEVELRPEGEDEEALYRLHQLVVDEDKAYVPPRLVEREIHPVPGYAVLISQGRVDGPFVAYRDEFESGPKEGGSWTLGGSYHRRRALEEDGGREVGADVFWQGDLTYDFFDESLGLYSSTQVLGRLREQGENVLGLKQVFEYRPFEVPLTFRLRGDYYRQAGDWSTSWRGSVSQRRELTPTLWHNPEVEWFWRHQSLNGEGQDAAFLDQDVFTEFKADHRYGYSLSDRVTWAPFRDTRLYAGAGLRSNEDLSVDSLNYEMGWRQLMGQSHFHLQMRGYRFLEDGDREIGVSRHRLSAEWLRELESRGSNRVEAGFRYTRFLEEEENAFLFLIRVQGNGEGFEDQRPGTVPFRELRERRPSRGQEHHSASPDLP